MDAPVGVHLAQQVVRDRDAGDAAAHDDHVAPTPGGGGGDGQRRAVGVQREQRIAAGVHHLMQARLVLHDGAARRPHAIAIAEHGLRRRAAEDSERARRRAVTVQRRGLPRTPAVQPQLELVVAVDERAHVVLVAEAHEPAHVVERDRCCGERGGERRPVPTRQREQAIAQSFQRRGQL